MKIITLVDEVRIESIERDGYGLYEKENIKLLFNLKNLYLLGWYSSENIFNCDKAHVDSMKKTLSSDIVVKSVGFSFNYVSLQMEKNKKKIVTQWDRIEQLLKNNVRLGVLSIIVLTSESWRFLPIAKACRSNKYRLNLGDSIKTYEDQLPVEAELYTLQELLNDWGSVYVHCL